MKTLFSCKKKRIKSVISLCISLLCCVHLLSGCVADGWDDIGVWLDLTQPSVTVDGEMEVHFIDVENADCILVRQGDKTMLIDAGERSSIDRVMGYLDDYGIQKFDVVIATHPHADHIGGMQKIIEKFPIDSFIMSFMEEDKTPTTATYLNMLDALYEYDVNVMEAVPGDTYSLGEASFQILAPYEPAEEANNASVVTRLTFGNVSFLLTGDTEKEVEKQMLEGDYTLSADIMKLGHHGSNTSNSMAFLRQVNPACVVITCGEDNRYGHPHQEVMDRLETLSIPAYRADECGDIVFFTDGTEWIVETKKE